MFRSVLLKGVHLNHQSDNVSNHSSEIPIMDLPPLKYLL